MHVALLKTNIFPLHFKNVAKRSFMLLMLIVCFGMKSFAQPSNDDPCNAIPLNAGADCTYQTFTNEDATATGVPDPDCAGYEGGDVWFQMTVPAASNGTLKFSLEEAGITDGGMAVYSGTCDNLTLIECNDDGGPGLMPEITRTGLTIGSTIWIRVWSYDNDESGDFGICIKYPGPPPAYDEPCAAVALPTPTTTCNYTTFTDDGALASAGVPDPGCAGYESGDVWFTVTVPPSGTLKIDTQEGDVTDGGMAIYSGTCDNLTLIECNDDASTNGAMPLINTNNLVPGSTVWIRFWSNGLTNNTGTFGICASIPPPAPANDDPCGAITLTASSTCNYQTFTTASATGSANIPPPPNGDDLCANYEGGDVWFKVVVPCEGNLVIDTKEGVITDAGMAAYSGTDCSNLQYIDCDDDGSSNGLMPHLDLLNLTPGSTIWLRVWEYGNDNPGTFDICVSVPPPPGPGASCFTGQPFCSSNTYTYPNSTNVPSLGENGIYGCLGTTPNPAWYYMQLQTSGSLDILIQQTNTAGAIVDVDYALWGPFPSLSSSCSNLSADNIVSCSYSIFGTETASIPNGQAGEFYILLITNYSNQPGTVTFNQSGGTGSTSCDIVCTLTSGNSGPVCPGTLFNLTASTVVNATYLWSGPNCFTSTDQNPAGITASSVPGMYIYTVTATTPSGTSCTSYDTLMVSAPPALGIDTTVYNCSGTTRDLTTLYTTTDLTTSWATVPGGIAVTTPSSVNASGIYQLIATNTAGCSDTALVTLVVDTVRSSVASTVNETCGIPGEISITNPSGVGNAFDYNISTTPGVYQTANVFLVPQGTYTIITRDSLGCTVTSAPVIVGFTDDLTVTASPTDTSICLGQSATIHATSNATSYSWLPVAGLNDASSASPVATPSDNTVYTVTASLGSCSHTASVNIVVRKTLSVDAGGPLYTDAGGSAQIQAVVTGPNINLSNILWTPSEGLSAVNILNPVATPVITSGAALYNITVTNTEGCSASGTVIVNVLPNCRNVRNAFTPNGDGKNDLWMVYDDYSCLKNVTVHVFNRYGSKVFESTDYRNTWDGRYSNKTLPDGTYYAVVEFTLLTGKVITVKSDLTILR